LYFVLVSDSTTAASNLSSPSLMSSAALETPAVTPVPSSETELKTSLLFALLAPASVLLQMVLE
jgi:hypothetical protein